MITDEQAIDLWRLAAIVLGKPAIANRYDDAASKLAREVLAMLARREAEQAERAKPIDAEWLLSIGWMPDPASEPGAYAARIWGLSDVDGDDDPHFHMLFASDATLWLECYDGGGRTLGLCDIMRCPSRGQLLDLLAALKGGAS